MTGWPRLLHWPRIRSTTNGDAVTSDIALGSEQIIRRACKVAEDISPAHEFTIPERDLTVTVFPGLSVISGTTGALASEFVEIPGGTA